MCLFKIEVNIDVEVEVEVVRNEVEVFRNEVEVYASLEYLRGRLRGRLGQASYFFYWEDVRPDHRFRDAVALYDSEAWRGSNHTLTPRHVLLHMVRPGGRFSSFG